MKRIISYCLIILLVVFCNNAVSAAAIKNTEAGRNEIEIPSDFDFLQQEHCSGHYYFLQASAQEDGKFITCTHYVNKKGVSKETYSRQYIDLYNSDGSFNSELSFYSTQPYVAEIKNDHINIYFYGYMIAFEIKTKEMHCFDIPDAYVSGNAAYDTLRQTTFTSGQWKYECTDRAYPGYQRLYRQNGESVQELVKMAGTNSNYTVVIIGGSIGVGVLLTVIWVHRKKNKSIE